MGLLRIAIGTIVGGRERRRIERIGKLKIVDRRVMLKIVGRIGKLKIVGQREKAQIAGRTTLERIAWAWIHQKDFASAVEKRRQSRTRPCWPMLWVKTFSKGLTDARRRKGQLRLQTRMDGGLSR